MIHLALPFPPSANRLWRRARKGMIKSDAYRSWLQEAGWMAQVQRQEPIRAPYKISIHATRPDKRKRDIDNLIKPVGDLLQSVGLVRDDCDCEMVSARWVTTGKGITVFVEPAGKEDQ